MLLQLILIEAALPLERSGQIPPYCVVKRGPATTIFLDSGQKLYIKTISGFGREPNEYYGSEIKAIRAAYAVGALCPALSRARRPPSVSKNGTYVAGIVVAGIVLGDLTAVTEVIHHRSTFLRTYLLKCDPRGRLYQLDLTCGLVTIMYRTVFVALCVRPVQRRPRCTRLAWFTVTSAWVR